MSRPGPGRNPTVDWHGEKRSNETHVAPKDPEAKLFCKGKGQAAKLCYMGHTLMDHRHGLIVDVEVTRGERLCRARNGAKASGPQ